MNIFEYYVQTVRVLSSINEKPETIANLIYFQLLGLQINIVENVLFRDSNIVEVESGIFKGMQLFYPGIEGAFLPKAMGTYEQELYPYIHKAISRGYKKVINIGCGDGYYAVGLALLMPEAHIEAYDTNPKAQDRCNVNALLNKTFNVSVFDEFSGNHFNEMEREDTLIICDIEGAEINLLDSSKYPKLLDLDFIVELHGIMDTKSCWIVERFAKTHDIIFVENQLKALKIPPKANILMEFQQQLLVYEKRTMPTPWAILTRKSLH